MKILITNNHSSYRNKPSGFNMRNFGLEWANFTVTCIRKLDEKINKANKV